MASKLFKECLNTLGSNATILSFEEERNMWQEFKYMLPIVSWGRVDWDKIEKKVIVCSSAGILSALKQLLHVPIDPIVYVFWSTISAPVIKADLHTVLQHIDEVTCVGPDTWLLNLSTGYVVEFFHEGEITVGVVPVRLPMSLAFKKSMQEFGITYIPDDATKKMVDIFIADIPRLADETVNWMVIERKFYVEKGDPKKLTHTLKKLLQRPVFDQDLYMYWEGNLLVKTNLATMNRFLVTISSVMFDQLIVNPHDRYLIQFCSDGTIRVGLVPTLIGE